MKEAASHQMDQMCDMSVSLGKGLKKTMKTYSKEAGQFARSFSEFVDLEDLFKTIHEVAHPEKHAQRKSSVVHNPIGELC